MEAYVFAGDFPAFPVNSGHEYSGITKREYFAAMALQGICSNNLHGCQSRDEIAKIAVIAADAVLKELTK